MADETTGLEVVQAFAEYERQQSLGVLGSKELPAEALRRKDWRSGKILKIPTGDADALALRNVSEASS
jgi:hypothetical protein